MPNNALLRNVFQTLKTRSRAYTIHCRYSGTRGLVIGQLSKRKRVLYWSMYIISLCCRYSGTRGLDLKETFSSGHGSVHISSGKIYMADYTIITLHVKHWLTYFYGKGVLQYYL